MPRHNGIMLQSIILHHAALSRVRFKENESENEWIHKP